MPTHHISFANDIRVGSASPANRESRGVPTNAVVMESFAPVVASANSVSTTQAVLAATLTGALINGAVAVAGVATFDVPRNIVAAWTNTAILTITGKDKYGVQLVETTASGTSHTGKKAFKTITKITTNADVTGLTAGSGAVLGLSTRPKLGGFIRGVLGENTADAGTYAAPERTASTGTTNDIRGTYAYAGTANGTNVFTVMFAADNGPDDFVAYGIAQYNP